MQFQVKFHFFFAAILPEKLLSFHLLMCFRSNKSKSWFFSISVATVASDWLLLLLLCASVRLVFFFRSHVIITAFFLFFLLLFVFWSLEFGSTLDGCRFLSFHLNRSRVCAFVCPGPSSINVLQPLTPLTTATTATTDLYHHFHFHRLHYGKTVRLAIEPAGVAGVATIRTRAHQPNSVLTATIQPK